MLKIYSGRIWEFEHRSDEHLLFDLFSVFAEMVFHECNAPEGFVFSSQELQFLEEVEHAKLRDPAALRFSSKFGDMLFPQDFSGGAKTMLCVLRNPYPDSIYNITEMGPNMWEYLFKHFGDIDRRLYSSYLGSRNIPKSGIFLNDKFYKDPSDFEADFLGALM